MCDQALPVEIRPIVTACIDNIERPVAADNGRVAAGNTFLWPTQVLQVYIGVFTRVRVEAA